MILYCIILNNSVSYHTILYHRNHVISFINKHIYRAGLSEVGDFFSILDNGDQALHLKQPLRFIYNIVKSTLQAIIYKTCDLFQKNLTSSSIRNLWLRFSIQACQVHQYHKTHHPCNN